MRKYSFFCLVAVVTALFLLNGSFVWAAEKTGFVMVREAMINTEAGKNAAGQLTKIFEKDRNSVQAKEKELQKLKDEIDNQRQVLKEANLKAKELGLSEKISRLPVDVEKMPTKNCRQRKQEVFKPLIPVMLKVITEIGEREQYNDDCGYQQCSPGFL